MVDNNPKVTWYVGSTGSLFILFGKKLPSYDTEGDCLLTLVTNIIDHALFYRKNILW